MKKINILMSAFALASIMPVFGSELNCDWTRGIPCKGGMISDCVASKEFRIFASRDIRFSDVMNKLDSALATANKEYSSEGLDDDEMEALKRVQADSKKYISRLPGYINDLLAEYDFAENQADLLKLKLLDIDCANQERVLANVDADMAWLAVEELEAALNTRSAFLLEMVKKHFDMESVAQQFAKLISFETTAEIRRIKGQSEIKFTEQEDEEYLRGFDVVLASLNLSREENDSFSLSRLMEMSLGLGL